MTRLKMPDDPRAVDLFEALNERFFGFIDQLPANLSSLARKKSTFLGSHESGDFEGVAGLNPVLASTPWLFWETFDSLGDSIFLDIAEAGTMYVLASILLDHLVDGHAEPAEEVTLLQQAIYSHGVTTYRSTIPQSSAFWKHFDRLAEDHLIGLALELKEQGAGNAIEMGSLERMAHGKVSPIVTTIAGLAYALDRPDVLDPIERSLKHIAVASQMLDDIGDWKHDVSVGHRTYYLSQITNDAFRDDGEPSIEQIQERVDEIWADVDHLRMVIDWLDDSVSAVSGLDCPGWIEYVEGYRKLSDDHLTTAIARHLVRKLKPMIEKRGHNQGM